MERNEIIEALECCCTNSEMDCIDCPYRNKGNVLYTGCLNALLVDALFLIKELTEENAEVKANWQKLKESHESDCKDCRAEFKRLTEENERLRAELKGANKDKQILFDEIASLEAEAEKAIDIAEGNIRAEIASGGTSCHWCEDKVKADTVREMQERLKKVASPTYCGEDCVYEFQIDQIAEEMIGETK